MKQMVIEYDALVRMLNRAYRSGIIQGLSTDAMIEDVRTEKPGKRERQLVKRIEATHMDDSEIQDALQERQIFVLPWSLSERLEKAE